MGREACSPDVDYLFKKFQKHIKPEKNITTKKTPQNIASNPKTSSNLKEKKQKIPQISKKVPVKLVRPRPLTMGCNEFEYMELEDAQINCQEIIDNINRNRRVLNQNSSNKTP